MIRHTTPPAGARRRLIVQLAGLALISSHPTQAVIPSSVTIPAGSRSTTFEIRRPGSTLGACVIVTATDNSASVQSVMLFRFTGLTSGTK